MSVLVLSTVFPNRRQPLHGLFVRERIRHLAAFADVRVVAPVAWFRRRAAIPRVEDQDGLSVHHPTFVYFPAVLKILDGVFLFFSTLRTVSRLTRDAPIRLVDAHFAYPDGFAATLLGAWLRCPVVITLRGSERVFVEHRLRRAAIGWALRRADRVIAVSQDLGRLALSLGVAPDRLDVIPNGVDVSRFRLLPQADVRRRLGIAADVQLAVAVGHLVPLKGFHRMVTAMAALADRYPRLTLAIIGGPGAGSGQYPAALQQLIEDSQLQGRVRLIGPQTPEQVAEWLNAANLLVLDSDREGCPNVVYEALACGCPVVAPRVGEVEHMVPADGGCLFDDPADVPTLASRMAAALEARWDRAAIRRQVEHNTWAAVAERVRSVWAAALAGAGGQVPLAGSAVMGRGRG